MLARARTQQSRAWPTTMTNESPPATSDTPATLGREETGLRALGDGEDVGHGADLVLEVLVVQPPELTPRLAPRPELPQRQQTHPAETETATESDTGDTRQVSLRV